MNQPDKWTEDDLSELIALKQEECLQLEFKRAESLDATDQKKKTEISKDVSAFANSAGGTIVYGIAESSQQPSCAESFSAIDPAKSSKEWLEQVIHSRIQPHIHGIVIHPIELQKTYPGQYVYVVSIPQSETAHLTGPSFCTCSTERVYITALGCEICFGTHGLQAAGAGGL